MPRSFTKELNPLSNRHNSQLPIWILDNFSIAEMLRIVKRILNKFI